MSNSSLDVGYRVGSAAEQDQIADMQRKCETRKERDRPLPVTL